MAVLASQISALHGIGADAMDNLYDIIITPPARMERIDTRREENIETQLRLRCEGFEPPKFTQKKYEVRYKTVGINRPAAAIEGSREFSLTFRLDAYYQVYTTLLDWRSVLFEPTSGYASPALPSSLSSEAPDNHFGAIQVYTFILPPHRNDASFTEMGLTEGSLTDIPGVQSSQVATADVNTKAVSAWEFKQVWISDLTEPSFVTGGGNFQKVTATFQFGEYRAPSSPETT